MQRRRQSGELDVFGATRYFDDGLADLATGPVTVGEPGDQMIKVKIMTDDKEQMEESYHTQELGPKTKSNLAAFFGSMLSPPEASFRKNPPAASSMTATGRDEPPKVSSSSSRGSSDIVTAAAGCGHDLGVVMGDRRLQGVRVVRSAAGDEERWVVRCGAWEEERHVHEKMFDAASSDGHQIEGGEGGAWEKERHVHEKMFDAASSDGPQVKGGEDGDGCGWKSDSSSDLFELDLEDTKYY